MGSYHLNLRAVEPLVVFSAEFLPYFDDGISPTRESFVDGISPTLEDNSTDGFTLTLEIPDRHRVGVPIRDRRIQSVNGLNPHYRPIFCRSDRTMATYGKIYIYEGFLVWIIPSTYRSRAVISSIILLRTKNSTGDLPRTKASGMI